MKKLMTAMAVCAVAGFSLAQGVSSVNVVGYQTLTIKPGFAMLSVNFGSPADSPTSISLQNLFSTNGLYAGTGINNSDQIQVWNGSTFNGYYFRTYKVGNPYQFLYPSSWVGITNVGVPTVDTIPAGMGFWINRPAAGGTSQVTVAGQVLQAATNTFAIHTGFNMIGSAFPVDFPLNAGSPFDWSTATAGTSINNSDQIQIWNGSTFNGYYYRMYKVGNPYQFLYPTCWVGITNVGVPTVDSIPAGQGFWYKNVGSAINLNQTSPIAN